MKKLCKVLSVILSLIIILLSNIYAFASSDFNAYDTLLQYGYSEDFLDSLSEDFMLEMINQIDETEQIKNIYTKRVYLYENINDGIQTCGTISSNSLALEITAAEICKLNTTIITRILISVSWDWEGTKPFQRKQDAITVNWDANLFSYYADCFVSQDFGKTEETDEWTVEQVYDRPAKLLQGGLGFYTQMSALYIRTAGAALFFLQPKDTMLSGNSKVTDINVNYVHDRSMIFPLSIGFKAAGLQVDFDISGSSYDEAADAANFKYS